MQLYDTLNSLSESSIQAIETEMNTLPRLKPMDIAVDLIDVKETGKILLIRHTFPERISFAALNLVLHSKDGKVIHKEGLRRLGEVPPVSAVPLPLKKDVAEKVGKIAIEKGVITEESILCDEKLSNEDKDAIMEKTQNWLRFAPVIQPDSIQFAAVTIEGSVNKGIEIAVAIRNGKDAAIAGYQFDVHLTYKGNKLTESKGINTDNVTGKTTWLSILIFNPDEITSSFDIIPLSEIEVKASINEKAE